MKKIKLNIFYFNSKFGFFLQELDQTARSFPSQKIWEQQNCYHLPQPLYLDLRCVR